MQCRYGFELIQSIYQCITALSRDVVIARRIFQQVIGE